MKQSAAFKGSYLNIISKIWREETQVISAIFSSRRIGSVALGEGEPPCPHKPLSAARSGWTHRAERATHHPCWGAGGGGDRTESTAIPEGRSGRNNSPSPETTARENRYATELPGKVGKDFSATSKLSTMRRLLTRFPFKRLNRGGTPSSFRGGLDVIFICTASFAFRFHVSILHFHCCW